MQRVRLFAVAGFIALFASGCTLYGWGLNTSGQLGDGTLLTRSEPVAAARNPDWVSVDVGDSHSCGIDISLAMYCGGAGSRGQLGGT